MTKKTTSKKVSKKVAKVSKKVAKAERQPRVEFKPTTVLIRTSKRDKSGPKQKLLELIPKGGVTVQKLTAEAVKKAELPKTKIMPWIQQLYGWKHLAPRA